MNKYQNKDGHIIFATEKAFKVLYERQGYVPFKEKKTKSSQKSVNSDGTN
ncbi:hypothetical protein ACTXGU_00180 [Niallia sp. 01092]